MLGSAVGSGGRPEGRVVGKPAGMPRGLPGAEAVDEGGPAAGCAGPGPGLACGAGCGPPCSGGVAGGAAGGVAVATVGAAGVAGVAGVADTAGAADGAGAPSDFCGVQASTATGSNAVAASDTHVLFPMARAYASGARRGARSARPAGHTTRVGPELIFVGAVVAAIGALSASRQGRRDILVMWRRGHASLVAGRHDDAEECFRATLVIAEQRFGLDHWRTALHVNALAQALVAQKRLDEAAPLVDRALGIVERWSPMPHVDLAHVLLGAAHFEGKRGRYSRAMALVDRARDAFKGDAAGTAAIERLLATLESNAGNEAEAADALARIPFERLEARDVRSLASFSIARLAEGDTERAVRCLVSAHALVERQSPGEFAEAFYLGLLGEALARGGRDEEARHALEQAVIDYDAVLGERHPATAALLVELAEVRLRLGDPAGARGACERVLAMRVSSGGTADEPYRSSALASDPLGLERDRAQTLLARTRRG